MIDRRRFLVLAGGSIGASLAGCQDGPGTARVIDGFTTEIPDAAIDGAPGTCLQLSEGQGLNYCLLERGKVRVIGAGRLSAGQVVLMNVDDNSAAIVGRDARGFYGLSAICPHACCILDLCGDQSCDLLRTNPGDCRTTPVTPLVQPGRAFLCACHGSEFAGDGTLLTGPATTNLPAVHIALDGEDVIADLATPVPGDRRVLPA